MTSENILVNRAISRFLPDVGRRGIVVLTGARQTGKTTLVKEKYTALRYISLDSPENREFLRKVSSESWPKSVGDAVIDEAQKEPVVFEKVKYAYDGNGIRFTVLTGSSQILLLKKIRESLAGRAIICELWPLLLSELTGSGKKLVQFPLLDSLFVDRPISNLLGNLPEILLPAEDESLKDAEEYLLQWGGMPALLTLSEAERWRWLKDYIYTYLERDLSDLAHLTDLQPFAKFQQLSALRSGQLLNYSELARDTAIGVDTARRYLEYLRLSYQVLLLQPYYRNLTSSAIKTPKLYLLDIGILRSLSGKRGSLDGDIYETMVVAELYKWIKTAQRNVELFFYRTRTGFEVDLLLKTEYGIFGIEIKARKKLVQSDFRQLKEIAGALGSEWRGGLVIYQGDEIRKLSEPDIWAVPSRRLFT